MIILKFVIVFIFAGNSNKFYEITHNFAIFSKQTKKQQSNSADIELMVWKKYHNSKTKYHDL